MNKFKIIFKAFVTVSIFFFIFISVISVLSFFLAHVYVFLKIFYNARPGFEFQGRIIK